MKGLVENGEIIQELEVKSCEKGKTESEVEIIEVKQLVEKTTTQKEYHSISENIIKKGLETKSKEQESSSQVKQIYDELIQENDYHTKISSQRQLKTEKSQQIKISDVDTETKRKKVEHQNKKFESKDNITYTNENVEQNNRKYSTGKNGINNRVQNMGEIIEDKVPVEMTNIQIKTKQQDDHIVANKTSNYQQQKEATGNGRRKEKGEEPKCSDSEQEGNRQDL